MHTHTHTHTHTHIHAHKQTHIPTDAQAGRQAGRHMNGMDAPTTQAQAEVRRAKLELQTTSMRGCYSPEAAPGGVVAAPWASAKPLLLPPRMLGLKRFRRSTYLPRKLMNSDVMSRIGPTTIFALS
eukprot:GHVU01173803.1.p2 GENE.GHVU01173803.1~~GHVU01173803.1.p2  ORF type:complete len:126 (+),score=13.01 GHVU01173803.1:893-1270(+)